MKPFCMTHPTLLTFTRPTYSHTYVLESNGWWFYSISTAIHSLCPIGSNEALVYVVVVYSFARKKECLYVWVGGVGVEVMGWGGGCMRHCVMACWRTGCKTLFEPLVSKSNGPWFCWRSIITSLKGQGKTSQSWWVSGVGGREFEKAHWLRSSSVGYVTLQTLLGLPSWCYAMYAIKSLRVSDLLLSCSDLT